jgi:hypothetical protein
MIVTGLISPGMRRSHRIIFFLIALLALATFVFGLLQLIGARR